MSDLLRDAADFAVHPSFAEAVKRYCIGLARLREAPRLVNAMVTTDTRWRIVGYLNYLAEDRERFGLLGGATYGRLLRVCTKHDEASPRTLKTLLGLLRVGSLVRVERDEQDSRIGYYVPTSRMNDFVKVWMRYATEALDLLEPEVGRTRFLDNPTFRIHFQVSGGRAYLSDDMTLADRVPEPMCSMKSMLGSYSVIAGVMEADLCGRDCPTAASLAWRFGLSRSQVGNVFAAGQEAGVFILAEGKRVRPTAALRRSFADWISIELAFYARHMRPPGEPLPPVADDLA